MVYFFKFSIMIVITGAAGFIGSALTAFLNDAGYNDLVLVDDFSNVAKTPNLSDKKFNQKVHRDEFVKWLRNNHRLTQFVFHLGARTDTTENDYSLLSRMNFEYSRDVFSTCTEFGIPIVYASSAATYGDGALGFSDLDDNLSQKLMPLNPYGVSKNEMDKWVLQQNHKPGFWAGLKFFNVFGPNEYHKGRMASVMFHSYNQICKTGQVKLFKSHKEDFGDGMQKRDFIYVKDVCRVCYFFLQNRKNSGLYNLGTGEARTFLDLVNAVFSALGREVNVEFIDIPEDIRNTYQYFTEADMQKLCKAGYEGGFTKLEDAIDEYVRQYLVTGNFY